MSAQGAALDQYLRTQYEIIRVVHDNLDAIRAVASHLTPVEDLVDFQDQVGAVYTQLGLLVEASGLLTAASDAGLALLDAADAPAQRGLLGLGDIATHGVEEFATTANFVTLTEALTTLQAQLTALDASKVDQAEFDALGLTVSTLQTASGEQATQLFELGASLGDATTLLEAVATQANTNTTQVGETADGLASLSSQVTSLASEVNDATTGLAGQATALADLTSTVTEQGDALTAQSEQLTVLQAQGDANDAAAAANASAISALTTTVNTIGDTVEATSEDVIALSARLDTAEGTEADTASALESLTARVALTESGLAVEAVSITDLKAALTSAGNLLPNTGFELDTASWDFVSRGAGWTTAVVQHDMNAVLLPPGIHSLGLTTPAATEAAAVGSTPIAVEEGKSYLLSGYLAADQCTAELQWRLLDATGAEIGFGVAGTSASLPTTTLSGTPRVFQSLVVPAGAVSLVAQLWATSLGAGVPRAWLYRPMLEEQVAGQVNPSPWVASNTGALTGLSSALEVLTARVTDDEGDITALSSDITTLQSQIASVGGDNLLFNSDFHLPSTRASGVSTNKQPKYWLQAGTASAIVGYPITSVTLPGTTSGYHVLSTNAAVNQYVDLALTTVDGDVRPQVTPGEVYTLGVDVRGDNISLTTGLSMAHEFRLYVQFLDASNAVLSTEILAAYTTLSPTTFKRLILTTAPAPVGAVHAVVYAGRIFNRGAAVSSNLWFEATRAQIQEGSVPTAWSLSVAHSAAATTDLETRVTTTEAGITTLMASYTLTLNVDGYITGWKFTNDGTTGVFAIAADKMSIKAPTGYKSVEFANGVLSSVSTTYARYMGVDIGPLSNYIDWYGPKPGTGVAGIADAGALFYIKKDGTAYFAGALTADNVGAQMNGRGVNLLWAEYTTFVDTVLPTIYKGSSATITRDTANAYMGFAGLKVVPTAPDAFVLLNATLNGNIPLECTKTYLSSFYVKSNGAAKAGQVYLYLSTGAWLGPIAFTTNAVANTWSRIAGAFTIPGTAGDTVYAALRVDNEAAGLSTMWFDGFMLEERVGTLNIPSSWQPGVTHYKVVKAQNDATQALSDAATAQGTASTAVTNAATAQAAAVAAQNDATSALNTLTDISADNLLTPSEKKLIITDVTMLLNQQAGIDAQAAAFALSATAYNTSITALTTYLATLTAAVLWSNMAGNTTIVRTDFRQHFLDVYTARDALLNSISAVAKAIADGKINTYDQTTAPSGTIPTGSLWRNPDTGVTTRWDGASWLSVGGYLPTANGANLAPNSSFQDNLMGYTANAVPTTAGKAIADGWLCMRPELGNSTTSGVQWTGSAIKCSVGSVTVPANSFVAPQARTIRNFAIEPGAWYQINFDATYALSSTLNAGITANARFSVAFLNAAGTQVGIGTLSRVRGTANGTGAWQDVQAPATAVMAQLFVDVMVSNANGVATLSGSGVALVATFNSVSLVKKSLLAVPGSGVQIGDTRNLLQINVGNGTAKVPTVISYTATAGAPATATISCAAFTVLSGSWSLAYGSKSVGVTGTNGATVNYFLYLDDPSFTGTGTLVATTNGNAAWQADGRVYIGAVSVTFPTTGTGTGSGTGGGGPNSCVCIDQFLREDLLAVQARPGKLLDVLDLPVSDQPFKRRILAVEFDDVECVEIRTDCGAIWRGACTTPFDLLNGQSKFAPDMLGELVVGDRGISEVISVQPIGMQPVAHIHLGGISYASGDDPTNRIFSHNALKP